LTDFAAGALTANLALFGTAWFAVLRSVDYALAVETEVTNLTVVVRAAETVCYAEPLLRAFWRSLAAGIFAAGVGAQAHSRFFEAWQAFLTAVAVVVGAAKSFCDTEPIGGIVWPGAAVIVLAVRDAQSEQTGGTAIARVDVRAAAGAVRQAEAATTE
jgi:hypothetical protein